MPAESLHVVGTSPPRLDARAKVTGHVRYTTDLALSGMVYAKIWRSPLPHAQVVGIDTRAIRTMPGVLAILTAADLQDCEPYYGPVFQDQPLLAIDRVRYAGEPVAVVIAETERQAAAAVPLLEVTLTALPAVLDVEAALAPEAPLLHAQQRAAEHPHDLSSLRPFAGTNVCHHSTTTRGNIAQGFAEADDIFTDTFRLSPTYHYAMEPHAALAKYEAHGITVWTATQHPFPVRQELARMFGLPLAAVQVIVPPVGGAYGSKCDTKIEPLTVACARKVRRPVRLALSVSEACHTITSHGAVYRLQTGVRRDGTLIARQCDMLLNTGAYAAAGPHVVARLSRLATGPYRIPHVQSDCRAIYTNTVPAGALRGSSMAQITWVSESQLDRIADYLGLDPLELRQRNFLRRGEALSPDDLPMDADLPVALQRTAAALQWQTPAGHRRAQGIACASKDSGTSRSISTAVVRVHADGSVTLFTGAVDHGQGVATVLAQIVAETLGVELERITVTTPDTALTPYDQGTSSSRTTTQLGQAVYAASQDARTQLIAMAAALLGTVPEAMHIYNGQLRAGETSLTFAEAIAQHFGHPGGEVIGKGLWPLQTAGQSSCVVPFWEMSMGAAEVEVDEETGAVKVLQYVSLADVGRAIHRQQCEAQNEGGAMQGLGTALFEALISENGPLRNANLIDYRVPVFEDLPERFATIFLEEANGPGPYGAKGVGESGMLCAAPAVGNAIARVIGAHVRELPMTPERVWRALREASPGRPRHTLEPKKR